MGIDLSFEHKTACPRCRRNGNDTAGNNLHVYGEDKGAFCWSCEYTIPSKAHREAMGWDDEEDEEEEVITREKITPEEHKAIREYTTQYGQGYRGINDETNEFFGVRYQVDEESGEVCKQFFPTTVDYKLVGFRTRTFPKDFSGPIGQVGKECDMVGEVRFQSHTRTVVITGGENKVLTTYQMLYEDQKRRDKLDYESVAVVCSTLGEGGAYKQIQTRYEFFNRFQKIVVCMDNDKAGREAAEKIAKVLPKGKVFIMSMRHKDSDDYIAAGDEREFVQDFWNARPYVPSGIVGSGQLFDHMIQEASREKIPFPPFMSKVNEMTCGGMSLGKIVNLGAASGIGKTVYVDEIIHHLIFNSEYLIGVVSMELNAGQYGISMLSRHMGIKINDIHNIEDRLEFLNSEKAQKARQNLFYREDGSHRWMLVDERDGSVEDLMELVEQLVIECGCKFIILDPLQDILDGLPIEEQAKFLKWQKGLIKSHGITFFNVNHVRKSGGGQKSNSNGAMISEEDFAGSSTIFKSGALNILLVRDKMAEDAIERNTTKVFISKNRDHGLTGPAGEMYYEYKEHKLYDKEQWLSKQPAVDFVNPDTGEVTKGSGGFKPGKSH